ncbi:hypothetical protein [Salibacterium aidingense]|uniref:hypothetical protein n=1 Tax=Salibacterium aidingense TaxID=384933 RepID=UPI003BBA9DA0
MSQHLPTATEDDILNELNALVTLFSDAFPDAKIIRQTLPRQPEPNTFVIRFQSASIENETALTYVETREWQIIYVSGTAETDDQNVFRALRRSEKLTIGDPRMVIPINDGSLRYMRVANFGISQVAELEGEQKSGLGVLQTTVRKARDIETYEKITETGVRRS